MDGHWWKILSGEEKMVNNVKIRSSMNYHQVNYKKIVFYLNTVCFQVGL